MRSSASRMGADVGGPLGGPGVSRVRRLSCRKGGPALWPPRGKWETSELQWVWGLIWIEKRRVATPLGQRGGLGGTPWGAGGQE